MTIAIRMICYLIILILISYSLLRYFHLWTRTGIPYCLYYILQGILLLNLLICQRRVVWIPNEILRNVLQGISAVYLSIMLYTPPLCFVRGIIRWIGDHKKKKGRIYRFFNHPARSIYCFLIFSICVGVLSFIQMRHISMTEYSVAIEKNAGQDNMKVALISDAHIGSAMTRTSLSKTITRINETKPDIVILCGDIFDSNTTKELREYSIQCLNKLQTKYGIYYIEGNQEVHLKEDLRNLLKDSEIKVLLDQTITLQNGIQLVGLRDLSDKRKNPVDRVLQSIAKESPVIVASHRPVDLETISSLGVDLTVCGHTIGGQYPLGFLPVSLVNDMVYGQKKIASMTAVTTSGAGGYGIPSKVTSKSEFVLIQLQLTGKK